MAPVTAPPPRKSASQARSRATVEALIEATARILSSDGYDRASTNRIASLAGVSIGSFYQYFPSKESVVAALVARHNREMLEIIRGVVAHAQSLPLGQAVRALVEAMVDAHRLDPTLHRIFAEQVPRMGQWAEVEAIERETFLFVQRFLAERVGQLTIRNLDAATFICVTTVESLTHELVIRRPEASDSEIALLVDEMVTLITRYLETQGQ